MRQCKPLPAQISADVISRFFAKVKKSDDPSGCWKWVGETRNGYGRFFIKNERYTAHRISLHIVKPQTDEMLIACHHCDFPSCVNPEHLYWGTHKENSRDAIVRGRNKKIEPPISYACYCLAMDKLKKYPVGFVSKWFGIPPEIVSQMKSGKKYINYYAKWINR